MPENTITQKTLDSFVKTYGNHTDASDETLLKAFPEFNGDVKLLKSAKSYYKTRKNHPEVAIDVINAKFPEFFASAQSELPESSGQKSPKSVTPDLWTLATDIRTFSTNPAMRTQAQKDAEQVALHREQVKKEQAAQLPISDDDKELQEQIRQSEIAATWGKPNGFEYGVDKKTGLPTVTKTEGDGVHLYTGEKSEDNDEIDAKKKQLPTYLTREEKNMDDVMTNVQEAWTSNSEEGRKALSEFEKSQQELTNELRGVFDATEQGTAINQKYSEEYQQAFDALYKSRIESAVSQISAQYQNGTLTEAQAKAKINNVYKKFQKEFNDSDAAKDINSRWSEEYSSAFEETMGDTYEERIKDAANAYNEKLFAANGDYIRKREREIGMSATASSVADWKKQYEYELKSSKDIMNQNMLDWRQANREDRNSLINVSDPAARQKALRSEALAAESKRNYDMAHSAEELIKDTERLMDAVKNGKSFTGGFVAGVTDMSTWDLGLGDVISAYNLKQIVEKQERYEKTHSEEDKLTAHEQMLLDASAIYAMSQVYYADLVSRGYKAGQSSAASVPYILEFAVMPIEGMTNSVAKGVLRYGVGRFGKKFIPYALRKTAAKGAGSLFAAGVQTATFGGGHITADYLRRTTGNIEAEFDENGKIQFAGITPGSKQGNREALWNAAIGEYNQNLGEIVLGSFSPLKRTRMVQNMFKGVENTQWGRIIKNFRNSPVAKTLDRTQWNGILAEDVEENITNLLDWVGKTDYTKDTEGLKKAGFNLDDQIDTFFALVPTSIFFGSLNTGAYYVPIAVDAVKLRAKLKTDMEKRMFDDIMSESRKGTFGREAHDLVRSIVTNPELSHEAKYAMLKGLYARYNEEVAKQIKEEADQEQLRRKAEQVASKDIQGITHEDGYIYHVGIEGEEGAEGYVTSGYLSAGQEGDMLWIMGDGPVTVKMNDGTERRIATNQLTLLDLPEMASDRIQAETDKLFSQYTNIDLYNVGDKVYINGTDQGTITEINDNGIELDQVVNGEHINVHVPREQIADVLSKDANEEPEQEDEESVQEVETPVKKPIEKHVSIDGKDGIFVSFSGDLVHFNGDGSIDESKSKKLVIKDGRNNVKRFGEKKKWLDALNVTLRNERAAARKRAQDAIDAKVAAARQQREDEDNRKAVEQKRRERAKELQRDTPTKDGWIDTKHKDVTPEMIFYYNMTHADLETAFNEAVEQCVEDTLRIQELRSEEGKKLIPKAQDRNAEIHRCEARIAAYEKAVEFWVDATDAVHNVGKFRIAIAEGVKKALDITEDEASRTNDVYEYIETETTEKDGVTTTKFMPYRKTKGGKTKKVTSAGMFVDKSIIKDGYLENADDVVDVQVLETRVGTDGTIGATVSVKLAGAGSVQLEVQLNEMPQVPSDKVKPQEPATTKLEARSDEIYDHIKVETTKNENTGLTDYVYIPYAKAEEGQEPQPVKLAGKFINRNIITGGDAKEFIDEHPNDIRDIQVTKVQETSEKDIFVANAIITTKDGQFAGYTATLNTLPKVGSMKREKQEPTAPPTEEPATDALRPFDENGNRIEDVVLIRRKSRAEYKLAKKSEIPDKWREAKSQRVVYVGADRTPALIRVEQEMFGKEVPVYLSNGKQAVVPVQDILVKNEDGDFVSFTNSDWYSVHEVGTPKSFEEIKNHVIFQRFTFGDLLNMGYEAFYTAVDKETGKGIPSSVIDDIHRAIVLWNRYVAGAAQKSKSIAALKPDDLARYRAMQYAILKSDRSAAAAAHDMTRLAQIEERLNSIVLQVAMISSNTAGKATDAVLKKATWENPLNRLVVAMELAQKLGYIQESELPDMQLPEELEKEASMDVITSAELEKMREQYNADKAAGKGLAQYDNFPELAREGQLVSRYRFVMRKKKGGGEAEVNGYDDVKGIYKNIDEAADVTKTTEQAAKEYEEFLKMLSDAYQAYQQGNGKLLSKINKNIATAIKAHPKDANYTLALARMNGKIAQEEAAKYPALTQSVILHQEIAEIEQKIQSVNDDIAAEEKKAEEEKREPKRLAVAQMLPSFREQLAAKTAELDALNEQNPDLDAAYQEYVQTERPQQGVVIAFPTKEQRGIDYSTWTPVEVDRKAVNQQIDELTKQHEALQEELKNTKQRARQNELKAQMNDLANQIADLRKSLVRPKVQLQTGENVPMAEFTETEKKSKQARLAYNALVAALRRIKGLNLHMVGRQEEARRVLEMIQGREKVEFFRAKDGTIYGWSIGNDMYLTNEGLNPETPIHEYTHIWLNALKVGNKAAYDKVLRAIKARKGLWEKVTKDPAYSHLTTDEEIASEVLARYSGKRGAARLMEVANELYGQNPDAEPTTLTKTFISKMQSILKEFWDAVKGLFGIKSMDDISDWVLKDMFDGKPLDFNTEEMQAIKDKAVADGTFMKTPDGRPTKLTEKQWLQVRTKAFKEWYGDWENPKEGEFFLLDGNEYVRDPETGEITYKLAGEPLVVYHGSDRAGFDIFDPKDVELREGQEISRSNGRGIFLTSHFPVASVYTTKDGNPDITTDEALIGDDSHHGIYSLYNNMHNPLIIDCSDEEGNPSMYWAVPTGKYKVVGADMPTIYFDSYDEAAQWMYDNGFGVGNNEEEFEPEIVPDVYTTDQIVSMAQGEGYDGVVFLNILDGGESTKLLANDNEAYMQGHDVMVAFAPNQVKSATQNSGLFGAMDDRIQFQAAVAEYDASVDELQNITKTASANLIKAEKEGSKILSDPNMPDGLKMDAWGSMISKYADMMEGMRIIQNSIAAYRKARGLDERRSTLKRAFGLGSETNPVTDVRTMFEAAGSAAANLIKDFRKNERKNLEKAIWDLQKKVKDSKFYKDNKTVTIKGKKQELTPLQFIELYLMARNNWERAEDNKSRGVAVYAEMFATYDVGVNGNVGALGMPLDEMSATEQFARAFHDAYGESAVKDMWSKIGALTKLSLRIAHNGGLITYEEFERLYNKKFYVPQRGFWDVEKRNKRNGSELTAIRRNGKWINKLSGMQEAHGGQSLAEGPLAYIFSDVEEAIQKSENNKVKIALFNLLRDNADWCREPEIGFNVPTQVYYRVDPETGKVERIENDYSQEEISNFKALRKRVRELENYKKKGGLTEAQISDIDNEIDDILSQIPMDAADTRALYGKDMKDNEGSSIGVMVDGYQCEIVLPESFKPTADAFNGKLNTALQFARARQATGFFAAQLTVNNPTFWAVNIIRDVQYVNIKGAIEYGPLFNVYFAGNLVACQGAINKYLFTGKFPKDAEGKRYATYMKEFLESGGNTGYSSNLDLMAFRADVKNLDITKSKTGRVLSTTVDTLMWKHVANHMNEWSEITSRFAIYCSIREMGYDKMEGIKAAKNLSVNFDRKGLGSWFLNVFQQFSVFFNATIQGTMGKWRALGTEGGSSTTEKIGKVAFGLTVAELVPAFFGFLNALMLPDDDEKEIVVSDWDRDNFIILPEFGKDGVPGMLRIPLDQTTRVPWCIGVNMALSTKRGNKEPRRTGRDAANSILTSIVENSLPQPQNFANMESLLVDRFLGGNEHNIGELILSVLTPSYLEQMSYLAKHENFLGGKMRSDYGDVPEYEMGERESDLAKDLSKLMYMFNWFGLSHGGDRKVPSKHYIDKDGNIHRISGAHDINPKEVKNYVQGIVIPAGTIDIIATMYGLAWEGIDAATEDDYEFGKHITHKRIPVYHSFSHQMEAKNSRAKTVRDIRGEIKDFEETLNNSLNQAIRFDVLTERYVTEDGRDVAELLSESEEHMKSEAAKERYAELLRRSEYIEKQKALMSIYESEASRYAQMKALKVTNDRELEEALIKQMGEKEGKEKMKQIEEYEHNICLSMKYLYYEQHGLRWSNPERKNFLEFFQK